MNKKTLILHFGLAVIYLVLSFFLCPLIASWVSDTPVLISFLFACVAFVYILYLVYNIVKASLPKWYFIIAVIWLISVSGSMLYQDVRFGWSCYDNGYLIDRNGYLYDRCGTNVSKEPHEAYLIGVDMIGRNVVVGVNYQSSKSLFDDSSSYLIYDLSFTYYSDSGDFIGKNYVEDYEFAVEEDPYYHYNDIAASRNVTRLIEEYDGVMILSPITGERSYGVW